MGERLWTPGQVLKDGSKELWEKTRLRVLQPGGLFFFCRTMAGFPDLARRAHLPLCLFLEKPTRRSLLIEYPRKHLKTTIATVGDSLWRFACDAIRGKDLDQRHAYASSIKTNSQRMLRLTKQIVENSVMLQSFIPEMIPEFGNDQVWNSEEIIFPRQRSLPEPSIDTLGAGTKSTSRHYDVLKEDDLINEENWDSPSAIKKAIEQHQLYENVIESSASLRMIEENAWGAYDLNNHIILHEPSTAVFSVDAETGLNHNRSRHIDPEVMEMTKEWEDGRGVWVERFDRLELAGIREKVGARIYNAQYKNQPFDPDVVDFREEWLGWYDMGVAQVEGKKIPAIRTIAKPGKPQLVVPIRDLNIVAAWDPSMGRKDESDRSAFVVVGVDAESNVFVLDVLAVRKDPLDFIAEIAETIVKWGVTRVGIESVAFQAVLGRVVQQWLELNRLTQKDPNHPAFKIGIGMFEELKPAPGKTKEGRVRYLLSVPAKEGRIYLQGQFLELLEEWNHFPIGKTKDIMDALAYTAMLWERGETAEEEEVRRVEVDNDFNTRDSVTGY